MRDTEQTMNNSTPSDTEHKPKQVTSVADLPPLREYKELFYSRPLLEALSSMLATQIGRCEWKPNLGSFVCMQKIDHVSDVSETFSFRRTTVLASLPVLCGWDQEVTFPPEFDKEFVLTYNGSISAEFEVPEEFAVSSEEVANLAINDLAVVFAEHLADLIVEFFRTTSGSEFTPGVYMRPNPKLNQYKDAIEDGKVRTTVVFSWEYQCLVPSMPQVLDTFMGMSMDSVVRVLTHFDNLFVPAVAEDADEQTKNRTATLASLKDRYDHFGRTMVAGIANIYGSAAHAFKQSELPEGEESGPKPTTH